MHIHLFENFDLDSKASITWKEGVHIAYRSQGSYYMALYRLDDYYVEIQYHTCYDGIAAIHTFVCEDELQDYLEQVDLSTLFG
jgi:hypothetical protein